MPIYELDGIAPELPDSGDYWVAPDAHVIGRVKLGSDVGVWFGAVIRGDNEPIVVGARTNIQEGATLHTDPGFPLTIGEGCTIGHQAIVHSCTLGDNVLVGMGATILNGAKIGANSLVGANALVTEGKEFPEGSLIVGAPARAVRALDAATIEKLRRSAENYAANFKRFKTGCRKIAD
ncbi:MAG: gamma carbonic anhydrase family protein [Proteobacteria bacterium]|nr:gamma carbonic anhydrase family protein [Pseudomonadota bacterium]